MQFFFKILVAPAQRSVVKQGLTTDFVSCEVQDLVLHKKVLVALLKRRQYSLKG